MSWLVQGMGDTGAGITWKSIQRVGVTALFCLLLTGCGTGSLGVDRSTPDKSIITGSVKAGDTGPDDEEFASDRLTIQNAVSSANLEQVGEAGVAWANAETGSAGVVREIAEQSRNGIICRSFVVRRESYDGVALHEGETCLDSDGFWKMRLFRGI